MLTFLAQSTSALALSAQRASSLALPLFRPRLRNDLLSSYSGDAGHLGLEIPPTLLALTDEVVE
jgi:hypothetical protein